MKMIFKVLGTLIFAFSCWYMGRSWAARYVRRETELGEVIKILTRLAGQISFSKMKLTAAIRKICFGSTSNMGHFFLRICDHLDSGTGYTFREAFDIAVSEIKLSLKEEDIVHLSSIADSLGESNYADQVNQIRMTTEELSANLKEARKEAKANMKLWPKLGLIMATMIAIALF